MPRRTKGLLQWTVSMALTAMLVSAPAGAQDSTRSIMLEVFDALAYLWPLSLDEERFADNAQREAALLKVDALLNAVDALEAHAQERDMGFRLLTRSFGYAASQLKRYYDHSRPEDARFFLVDLTQNCVACHSRLPKAREFPFASRLLDRIDADALDPRDLAQIQIATRQFERALDTWEQLFGDPLVEPVDLDLEGEFIDYLTVSIRAVGDLARARRTFEDLLARDNLPFYLRRHMQIWVASLAELADVAAQPPTLAQARALFDRASMLSTVPAGRERAVHDLVASSLLYRLVEDSKERDAAELAEAYYLLGVIETRTAEPKAAVPQMEFHFEAAIRHAPHGEFAKPSYAILEEYSLLNYGGIPIDPDADAIMPLAELRKLIGIER